MIDDDDDDIDDGARTATTRHFPRLVEVEGRYGRSAGRSHLSLESFSIFLIEFSA